MGIIPTLFYSSDASFSLNMEGLPPEVSEQLLQISVSLLAHFSQSEIIPNTAFQTFFTARHFYIS
jgi:hypothetical protein